MSDTAKIRVVILWDHELRDAARSLKAFSEMPDTASSSERAAVATAALNACWAALWDLAKDPDEQNLTVMAVSAKKTKRGGA